MKLLERYIHMILEAQKQDRLFHQIVDKFSELTLADPLITSFDKGNWISDEKRRELRKAYNRSSAFRRTLCNNYVSQSDINADLGRDHFSFINIKAFEEYTKVELRQYDILVYTNDGWSYISYENLQRLFLIAKNCEQFIIMVKKIAKKI